MPHHALTQPRSAVSPALLAFAFAALAAASLFAPRAFAQGNPFGDTEELTPVELEQRALFKRIEEIKAQKPGWRQQWMDANTNQDELAKLAVDLAASKALPRDTLKRQLGQRADKDKTFKSAIRNLDIGRHQFLKNLFARAVEETNRRLAAKKLTPLDRTTVLNSGGTGDFTRDIDVTVFAGDDLRETTFFEAMRDLARKMGLKVKAGEGDSVAKGIEIDDLEVAFHRGRNDLPDPRFATDPVEFQLEYRRVIEQQAKNPEAYFGYGGDTEVVGRRFLSVKPGQTLVQTFEATPGGVRYTGQIASCMREARAILRGAADNRIRRAQRAIHATNDYLQAARHEVHAGLATQGALKYAGRGLDELAAFHGFKAWSELVREDRIQLLARMHPPGYLDDPANRNQLAKLEQSLEVAYRVYQFKALPGELGADTDEARQQVELHRYAALTFLRRACSSMATAVAQEMLDPPAIDPRLLAQLNQPDGPWQKMNAAERDALARQRDETYRSCVSAAAMENLLVTIEQLARIDAPEFNPRGLDFGDASIKQILDRADAKVRPLIELAVQHAGASVELSRPSTPEAHRRAQQTMARTREELAAFLKKPVPGAEIVAAAKQMGARSFIRAQNEGRTVLWSQGVEEMKERLRRHLEDSFPENSYESTRRQLQTLGVKGYVARRVHEEAFQLGNVVDALSLIEMYQGGAAREDYAWFIAQNLLGRCYWGLGYLMQAAQVRDEEALAALGQNLVFDALSRVIPGVAQAKIFFDIERGLVVVTVGWALNQANADLIDALYTGEAGRLSNASAGTVGGRIRDSGFVVLPAGLVRKVTDPKTKAPAIQIDQAGLYQHLYRQWIAGPAGREVPYDEVESRPLIAGPVGPLLAAHDALAKAILDVGGDVEPAWFGEPQKWQDKDRLDKAIAGFVAAFRPLCRKETDRVLWESAVREFYQNERDVIAEGLHQRMLGDLLGGMIGTWQTHRLEMQYARRQVEYMAGLGDMQAMSEALAQPVVDGDMPQFDIVVASGESRPGRSAYTRYGRLPLSCHLAATTSVPPNMQDVAIAMEPLEFVPGLGNEGFRKSTLAVSGVQKVRVVATADNGRGRVLADKIVEVPVAVIPDAMHVATLGDRLHFEVSGESTITETFREDSRTYEGRQDYAFHLPYPATQDPLPPVKPTWSGNHFTLSYEIGIDLPYPNIPYEGPVSVKAEVSGSIDPEKRTVSFRAHQTLVENEKNNSGVLTEVTTTTVSFSASDVPVGDFMGMGNSDAFFSGTNEEIGPTHAMSGTLVEHNIEYDSDDGSVRYETTKTAKLLGGGHECHAAASFIMSSIVTDWP